MPTQHLSHRTWSCPTSSVYCITSPCWWCNTSSAGEGSCLVHETRLRKLYCVWRKCFYRAVSVLHELKSGEASAYYLIYCWQGLAIVWTLLDVAIGSGLFDTMFEAIYGLPWKPVFRLESRSWNPNMYKYGNIPGILKGWNFKFGTTKLQCRCTKMPKWNFLTQSIFICLTFLTLSYELNCA